jgi:hypothetical protein
MHSIRQFPLHFPSRASQFAISFQMDPTSGKEDNPIGEKYQQDAHFS